MNQSFEQNLMLNSVKEIILIGWKIINSQSKSFKSLQWNLTLEALFIGLVLGRCGGLCDRLSFSHAILNPNKMYSFGWPIKIMSK